MNRLLAIALAGLLVWGGPALSAITVTQQNSAQAGSASHSLPVGSVSVTTGDVILATGGMRANALSDAMVLSDSGGNTWTVYKCPGAGTQNTFIAWAVATTPLVSGTVTVEDTSTGATNYVSAYMNVASVTGTSGEDTAARACGALGTNTPSPTVTSGSPTQAGDLFISAYGSSSTNIGFSWTEDTGNGWTTLGTAGGGNTTQVGAQSYLINAGSGAKTHAPTTTTKTYAMPVLALKAASAGATAVSHSMATLGAGH